MGGACFWRAQPPRGLAWRPRWSADPGLVRSVLEGVLLKKTDSVFDIWQQRDVVLTKKRLYFGEAPASVRRSARAAPIHLAVRFSAHVLVLITGRVGVDCICDSVPLEDIVCIYATNEADMNPENASEHAPVFRDGHVLEIATSEEGFTAGRSYLLKTKDLKVAEVRAQSDLEQCGGRMQQPKAVRLELRSRVVKF